MIDDLTRHLRQLAAQDPPSLQGLEDHYYDFTL